ncbi:MAG: tRNA-dihydrouridine synthase family protein [Proteobacteria bacterium]|nr:tRNA-dihydrouridine synthase family protein [Pseudomonadota bacterium]MBU4298030.1 tRNA-dihydrouridine synthase family protein [Pseudomonadota bacterium]MCG2749590.1 tRNA-dihydrouridine synthase family protein [Desulfobulbaceae bacterium]
MLEIRNLCINPPLLMAPMAGLTHSVFRSLLLQLGGVGLLSTEMLSARRLPMENAAVSPFLVSTGAEHPLSYQLLVADKTHLAAAIDRVHQLGGDAIDLNLGCPAPQVRNFGGGSKLVDDADHLRQLVAEARARTELPLTAKIRLGEQLDEARLQSLCRMLEGEGIDLLTVHARLRKEPFSRKPRWEWVGKVKSWLSIPVVANGGIFSVADGRRCLELSGADGLMLGRGAAIRPWLFHEIASDLYGVDLPLLNVDRPAFYFCFVDQLEKRFRPERRLGRLKEFTHYFSKTYPFGLRLASAVQTSSSVEEARERAGIFFDRSSSQPILA